MMRTAAALLALLAFAGPAAAQSRFLIGIDIAGDAERRLVRYDCEGAESFDVEYTNAAPNFLAFVPFDGQTYLMTSVVAGSGSRYAAANYVWWTKGPDAELYDLTQGEDAAPILTCSEHIQTP
ncbi:MAG TPA: MliC family protein [Devosia sp.]